MLKQVVSADGTFMTLSYEDGGECKRLSYAKFVKSEGDMEGGGGMPDRYESCANV